MLFSTLALLAAGKLLTNTLSPEEVGQFALLLLSAEFLGMIANLGLPMTLPKLLQARAGAERAGVLACLFAFQLAVALVLAAACAIAAAFGDSWLPLVDSWLPLPLALLAVLPVLLAAVAFRDFLLAGAAGLHDYRRRALAIALMSTLQVIFFTALFLGGPVSPLPFAASHLFAVAGGATLLARAMPRAGRLDWREAFAQVRFSAPLFANNLLNFVYQRADTLLVVYFLGIGTAALFEMAKRIPGVLSRFFGAALIPYLPSVTELLRANEHERAGRLLQRVSAYAAFTGYTVTLLTVAVQEPLLQVLFTADYRGAAPVLGPLLVAACLAMQAGIMGQALIALDRPHWVMYINVGLAAASFGMNIVLLPQYGLVAAGWSAAVAALFSYAMQRLAVGRAGLAVPAGRDLLVHAFFLAAYGLQIYVGQAPVLAAGAAILYGVGCFAARVVSAAELVSLFRRPGP